MLTAKGDDMDKILGLEYGADDYITKPFSVNELLARISAHLRREQRSHNKTKSKFSEDLIIDYSDRSLYIKGHKIELSNKEFEIIQLLSSNAGQVFDREKIYEKMLNVHKQLSDIQSFTAVSEIFRQLSDPVRVRKVILLQFGESDINGKNKRSISKDVAKTIISIAGGILS